MTEESLTQKQLSKLESLAETAATKLKALDKFSGRELAEALMEDKKTGEIVWSKGFFFLNSTAKAVKSAIEAQQTLSMELGKFNERLAQAPKTWLTPNCRISSRNCSSSATGVRLRSTPSCSGCTTSPSRTP